MMWENLGLPIREAKYQIKQEGLFPELSYAGATKNSHSAQQNKRPQQQSQQQQKPQQQQKHQLPESRLQTSDDSFQSALETADKTIIEATMTTTADIAPNTTEADIYQASVESSPSLKGAAALTTSVRTLTPKIPCDNFGETYLSMEDASESQFSEEDPPSQALPRRIPGRCSKKGQRRLHL